MKVGPSLRLDVVLVVVGESRLKPTGLIVSPENYRCRIVVGELGKTNWVYL